MVENSGIKSRKTQRVPLHTIFLVFLKVGAFTFGGGYAILPVIQREIVTRSKWVEREDFVNMLIVTQSIPGALALNSSIQVGMRLRGAAGGLLASLGIITPSVLIILAVVSLFLPAFQDSKYVEAAFYGLRPAVVALIAAAAVNLGQDIIREWRSLVLGLILLALAIFFDAHPIATLIAGGLAGLIIFRKKDS